MAQEVMFTASGAAPGTYYYALQVGDDGSITVRSVPFIRINGEPNPDPNPDPNPNPDPDLEPIKAKVKRWAQAVQDDRRPLTAKGIALVYRQTRETIQGQPGATVTQLKSLTDQLYGLAVRTANREREWRQWKQQVDSIIPNDLQGVFDAYRQVEAALEEIGTEQLNRPWNTYLTPPARKDDVEMRRRLKSIYEGTLREASCEVSNLYGLF